MRISGKIHDSIVDGPGFRFVVFTQGCDLHCEGCHNPGTWDRDGGEDVPVEALIDEMLSNKLTDGLTLSGGEPFLQAEECLKLAKAAHAHGLNVWAYTGGTFERIFERPGTAEYALLCSLDVLVDGPFMLSQRTLSLKWRGSRNQRVIDVPKSLASGEAIVIS